MVNDDIIYYMPLPSLDLLYIYIILYLFASLNIVFL